MRNKLVHEYEFNSLPDRVHFAKSYDSVEKELKSKLKESSAGACIICWWDVIILVGGTGQSTTEQPVFYQEVRKWIVRDGMSRELVRKAV